MTSGGAAKLPPLAAALKAYRKRHGLTVEQFGERYGIPKGTLQDFEQRARSPQTHLASLCASLLRELAE